MTELPIKIEPIVQQIQSAVPSMISGRDKAVAAMKNIQSIENDDDVQAANGLLVKVRATYDKIYGMRTAITSETDKLKEFLMQFEKDLDQSGKNNEVVRIRKMIADYNQKILDENNRVKAEAERQKQKENQKADVTARIKKNLADMLIQRASEVESGSKKFFDDTTLETWDARAKTFMTFRATLKQETYDKCFQVSYDRNFLSEQEFLDLCALIKSEDTFQKWSEEVTNIIAPILNDWRGRMDDIKADKEKLAKASEEERERIAKEQKEKAEHEEQMRKEHLAKMQKESDERIEQQKQVDKLQNDFREQAVTQRLEDAGPVKLLLRFKDPKPVKALTEVMYHCFMSDKFPDIQKKNKEKEPMFDEHGFPVYVDWVDTLVKFFVKNCDVNINGVEIKEVSKVIVRK